MRKLCEKCGSTMDTVNFYSSNNLERFPDGKVNKCKKCWTMHIDCWDESTYLPLLEEADVPYVEIEWKKEVKKAVDSGKKITGTTVIGKYLSRMRLSQYRNKRWADTEFYREQAAQLLEEALASDTMDEADKILLKSKLVEIPEKPADYKTGAELEAEAVAAKAAAKEKKIIEAQMASQAADGDVPNLLTSADYKILAELSKEDKQYLDIQWESYRPTQQVYLEKLYQDYLQSYDIQTAGHRDTLRLVCKASLKTNELMDLGDMDGAAKATRMYDSLMKSGKFTAAQNKAEKGEAVDSISEFAYLCEKEGGFIPRFYEDVPNDAVDKCLEDNKRYIKNLVVNEQGLGPLLEQAIKEMQKEAERKLSTDSEDLFNDLNEQEILSEVDFEEFNEFIEEEQDKDNGIE